MGATVSQNDSPPPPTASTITATTTGEEGSGSNSKVIKAAAKSSSNINDLDNQKVDNQNGRVGSSMPSQAPVPQLQSSDKKKIEEEKEKQKVKEKEKEKAKEKVKEKEPNNKQEVILNMGLPHNYHAITKDADDAGEYINNNNGSRGRRHRDVHSDVFLTNKTKKYWVDSYGRNCFMLFARDLSIVWGDEKRYWHWLSIKESSTSIGGEVLIDVAELSNVCWLEVHGKLNTSNLSPEIIYEVVFMVMLKDPAYGWEVPVNLRLTFPGGTKQEHKENLQSKPREQWVELYVGEFQAPSSSAALAGDIEISLFEYAGGKWKRGLVIKGIIIRPKQTKRV